MDNDKLRAALEPLVAQHDAFMQAQNGYMGNQQDAYNMVANRFELWQAARQALADNVPVDQDEVERMHDWLRDEAAIQCVGPDDDLHIDGDTWEHVFAPALRTRSNEDSGRSETRCSTCGQTNAALVCSNGFHAMLSAVPTPEGG